MSVWVCANCDHEYDSGCGDLRHGISPGITLRIANMGLVRAIVDFVLKSLL